LFVLFDLNPALCSKRPNEQKASGKAEAAASPPQKMKKKKRRKMKKKYICGHPAVARQQELDLDLAHPVQRGLVTNFDQVRAQHDMISTPSHQLTSFCSWIYDIPTSRWIARRLVRR
jgi:hypothetical protein